ncbi:hypothetical protein H012_gp620 [Acanthamoeba polyphaga moumouvirus]|uniref:Uncharacterized protein n=1 Tax=Acanthamoeba polyphaga moumouvirus TaxID=1269028 RepID=L7RCS7_9VIRU|nr:hypothetical protein H012_gp620 [Acanthamoeba polyphaga moumouvirus]AGC01843.1 hypothetical protein Moumou_00303 [Acanthamoeba polyphaga moumouvirus]AQN68202.1 hypothetical protein [Saudi moumouvirus]
MLNNTSIKLLLILYSFYQYLYRIFFGTFKKIRLVYFITDEKVCNITFNYYLGLGLKKYNKGTFYIKEYNINNKNHIAFTGKLSEIQDFKIIDSNPNRKNIIIMNNNEPCNFDLNILDNYKIHSDYYHESCIKNMSIILKILGINSTHINVMTIIPFTNKQIPIQDLNIDDLYF